MRTKAYYLGVCCILHAQAQFCRFDKVDTTANVQRHCNYQLWQLVVAVLISIGSDISLIRHIRKWYQAYQKVVSGISESGIRHIRKWYQAYPLDISFFQLTTYWVQISCSTGLEH